MSAEALQTILNNLAAALQERSRRCRPQAPRTRKTAFVEPLAVADRGVEELDEGRVGTIPRDERRELVEGDLVAFEGGVQGVSFSFHAGPPAGPRLAVSPPGCPFRDG